MTQSTDTHDVRRTRVCKFDKECWLDEKQDHSTVYGNVSINDVEELVVADWGNAVDSAFRFTNQAFNGYPANGLNVRGRLRGSRPGSTVGIPPATPTLIDLIKFEGIVAKSELYVTATIVGVDIACDPHPRKFVIEHHGIVSYKADETDPELRMVFRSTEFHEVYSSLGTEAGASLKIAEFPGAGGETLLAAEVWGNTEMEWNVDFHARQLPELNVEVQYIQDGDCAPA